MELVREVKRIEIETCDSTYLRRIDKIEEIDNLEEGLRDKEET